MFPVDALLGQLHELALECSVADKGPFDLANGALHLFGVAVAALHPPHLPLAQTANVVAHRLLGVVR